MWTADTITLPDGRDLDILTTGPHDGMPVVFHGGTPGAPVPDPIAERAAAQAGVFLILSARPGYGRSTRQPGRSVADVAADTAALLDHLGRGEFVTAGGSGGGPHALACAALLQGRCLAAATVAGVGPYQAPGLDFLAGMGQENVEEFTLAAAGRDTLEPWIQAQVAGMGEVTAELIIAGLGSLLPPVDLAVLTGEIAQSAVAGMRKAFEVGAGGWVDDDPAFTKPWGFSLRNITVPVSVWQGALDKMVPFAHGQWLAATIPGATPRLFAEHGHLSIAVAQLPEILTELVASAQSR